MLSKMTPDPTPVSGMTPRFPAFACAGDGDADDGRADLGGDGDRRRRFIDRDRLDGPDVRRLRRARRGGCRAIEHADRGPSAQDGADRREHGRQQRRDAAASRCATAGALSASRPATVDGVAGAGSYQRSGVTGGLSLHERAHSARGSGLGV